MCFIAFIRLEKNTVLYMYYISGILLHLVDSSIDINTLRYDRPALPSGNIWVYESQKCCKTCHYNKNNIGVLIS